MFYAAALIVIAALSWASAGHAAGALTAAVLELKIEEVNSRVDITGESKTSLTAQLQAAIKHLETERAYIAQAKDFSSAAESAEREINRFEQQLQEANNKPDIVAGDLPDSTDSEQIESQISLLQARRKGLAERRSQLLQEADELPSRRAEIQERLAELQILIDNNLAATAGPTDTLEQQVARSVAEANDRALQSELNSLKQEILTRPSILAVSSAERDWIARALADADDELRLLNEAAKSARATATAQELEATEALEAQMTELPPELQNYADRNKALAKQLSAYSKELEKARSVGLEMQSQLEAIEQDYSLMKRRLQVAGRKEILGRVMMTRLESLPNTDLIKRSINTRNELIAQSSLGYIDTDEELRAINSREKYIAERLPSIGAVDEDQSSAIEQLIDQRQQLLNSNYKNLEALLVALLDNNERADKLKKVSGSFHKFLVGNLMWVRNFSYLDLPTLFKQTTTAFSPGDWLKLPADLLEGYRLHNWSAAILLLLAIAWIVQRPVRSLYQDRLREPALLNTRTLMNLVLCLFLSLVIVLPWPLLLFVVAYFLHAVLPGTDFLEALAPAIDVAASSLYVLLLTRLLLSPRGVGRRLLKWDARMLDVLRRELEWAGPASILFMTLDVFALHVDVVANGGPLGAMGTLGVTLTILIFTSRLLRRDLFNSNRTLKTGLRVAVALAVTVIGLLVFGLLFAAEIYLRALCLSILMILAIKTLSDILQRALLILRSRLERKAKDEVKALVEEGADATGELDEQVDVLYLSEAHAKLLTLFRLVTLSIVLWLIWSPSMPALNLLESIPLWQVSDVSAGTLGVRTITLFDLALGVVTLVLTALVAKHLPALVQIFLLEWVKVGAGARYASSILMQYIVVAVGGSIFLTTVGWEWAKLQWLVAALGVGIGFGLQEIVANFISGIIILFEQPIRVGDIISAGGAEGTVKKISARATVIQTFDGKEHLIPNKELITGQVINWSLTENAIRIVISVGIAYGSDVRQAMKLLLEAASEVELVLSDPEPRATFEDFGDNSLQLWLRCYVAEDRPGAWTELRALINDKFADAGISIAFPQRDVHLDFSDSLKVEIDQKTL